MKHIPIHPDHVRGILCNVERTTNSARSPFGPIPRNKIEYVILPDTGQDRTMWKLCWNLAEISFLVMIFLYIASRI